MTQDQLNRLGNTLWSIANDLRGAMNADGFRDYMLSLLFLRYLSDNYENTAKKELGADYPKLEEGDRRSPLKIWYEQNPDDVSEFEKSMRSKIHYVLEPKYLWSNIAALARNDDDTLLDTVRQTFKFIEEHSFQNNFKGLFSEINLSSDNLGKDLEKRNKKLASIIRRISDGISEFDTDTDILGDAYEYLIGKFASNSGKKAGEFYTPQPISTILSRIVSLDSQDPTTGKKDKLDNILDFTSGSGSLLLNVRNQVGKKGVGKIYGQENNMTTYNLARMNMLLHGVKDSEFIIHHGDTLENDWDIFNELNPSKKLEFDAIVANPPFSLRWETKESTAEDFRFKNYGVAPKSAADFAFLLHGFHYLRNNGTMAIILPHGVLFRGGSEAKIRQKLLEDGNIDAVIGLPENLFYSTGIPVAIIVLKKCKKSDDVLIINASASENYEKGKGQNILRPQDIDKIIDTYQYRKDVERFSRKVPMDEIKANEYNLNITRYVSTAEEEKPIDLSDINKQLVEIESKIKSTTVAHNEFLRELGLELLPI